MLPPGGKEAGVSRSGEARPGSDQPDARRWRLGSDGRLESYDGLSARARYYGQRAAERVLARYLNGGHPILSIPTDSRGSGRVYRFGGHDAWPGRPVMNARSERRIQSVLWQVLRWTVRGRIVSLRTVERITWLKPTTEERTMAPRKDLTWNNGTVHYGNGKSLDVSLGMSGNDVVAVKFGSQIAALAAICELGGKVKKGNQVERPTFNIKFD